MKQFRSSLTLRLAATGVVIASASVAHAQTDSHLILDDWTKDKHFESDSSVDIFPRSSIGDGQSTQFTRAFSEGRVRLDPSMQLSPSIGYAWKHYELSSGTRLPNQLDDLSLGVGSPVFSQGTWFGGASVGLGYAGADAFAANHAWYGNANVFVGDDLGQGKTLIFALDYKGNRTLVPDVPIPSVEFDWKMSDQFEFAVGFPVSALEWRPTPKFTLSAEYDFPVDLIVEAKYQFLPVLAADARFVSDDDAFHVDSLGEDQRLLYQDNRIEVGLIATPCDDCAIHVGVGYAWQRKFVVGFDDRNTNTLADLQDQAYLSLGVDLKF